MDSTNVSMDSVISTEAMEDSERRSRVGAALQGVFLEAEAQLTQRRQGPELMAQGGGLRDQPSKNGRSTIEEDYGMVFASMGDDIAYYNVDIHGNPNGHQADNIQRALLCPQPNKFNDHVHYGPSSLIKNPLENTEKGNDSHEPTRVRNLRERNHSVLEQESGKDMSSLENATIPITSGHETSPINAENISTDESAIGTKVLTEPACGYKPQTMLDVNKHKSKASEDAIWPERCDGNLTKADIASIEYNQRYFNYLAERFAVVNQYCDLTFEPKTFNSLQKFKMGGSDPLDYIVCYFTSSNYQGVLDHWHYVSYGLSDIYGITNEYYAKAGFDFELTIRVKYELEHNGYPPTWPLDLLQKLARYVFSTKMGFIPGDNIPWPTGLDGSKECVISGMVAVKDYSIPTLKTAAGEVDYIQIVGVTNSELEAAQHWNAIELLEIFKANPELGGVALVTDIKRTQSIYELHPNVKNQIQDGMNRNGSNLTGINVRILWTDKAWLLYDATNLHLLNNEDSKKYEDNLDSSEYFRRSPSNRSDLEILRVTETLSQTKIQDDESNYTSHDNSAECALPAEKNNPILKYNSIHLTLEVDAMDFIPVAFRGRVYHKHHFTFKHLESDDTVTFVPDGMRGAFSNKESPFCSKGSWLHICLDKETCEKIIDDLNEFNALSGKKFPHTFLWPEAQFALTIAKNTI